jgi:Uma2 family endonuclease
MKAVVLEVSDRELEERHRRGLDRFDEMWEGVLHMAPAPLYEHQRIVTAMLVFLVPLCERTGRGTVVLAINVFNELFPEDRDYRIPDFTFVAAGNEQLLARDGIRGGGPDAVVEVRSPGDETYEKFPFFARLGIKEVIVVHRDSKQPEIFRLAGPQYVALQPDPNGKLLSETMRVRFSRTAAGQLAVEDADDPATRTEI